MKKYLLVAISVCMVLGFSCSVDVKASEFFIKESYYEISEESTIMVLTSHSSNV